MRHFALFLATLALAGSATAQTSGNVQTTTRTKSTTVEEIGYGGRNGGGTKSTTTSTVSTTTAPVPVPVPAAIPATGAPMPAAPLADDGTPLETIGYDAKVKRDPNGNVIGETKTVTTAPKKETKELRNDKKMRSDSSMIKKPAPPVKETTVTTSPTTVKTSAPTTNPYVIPAPATPGGTTTTTTTETAE